MLTPSLPPIHVGSVVDTQDPYDQLVVVDLVQQAVGAAAGTELSRQFRPRGFPTRRLLS